MKIDDIPQDNSASYHGHRKVIYGTRDGHYEAATSNGWQDEAYATEMAVYELDTQTQAAREAVEKANIRRCTICSAAVMMKTGFMAAGVWKWQLRRHFRPEVFAKLPAKTLQKYADACQISIDGLKQTDI